MIPWLSSRPAYPDPTPQWAEPSAASLCQRQGCPHVTDEAFDLPMPAFHWRSQGCYAAWLAARGGPMVSSLASVPRPVERSVETPLSWLGPALPRPKVPTYDEVVAAS